MWPESREQLARIEVKVSKTHEEAEKSMVVLRGPLTSLGASVSVSRVTTRPWLRTAFAFVSSRTLNAAVDLLQLYISYAVMLNFSLLLLNMLPVPFLDGSAFLHLWLVSLLSTESEPSAAQLDAYSADADMDVDDCDVEDPMPTPDRTAGAPARRYHTLIERAAMALVAFVLLGHVVLLCTGQKR